MTCKHCRYTRSEHRGVTELCPDQVSDNGGRTSRYRALTSSKTGDE